MRQCIALAAALLLLATAGCAGTGADRQPDERTRSQPHMGVGPSSGPGSTTYGPGQHSDYVPPPPPEMAACERDAEQRGLYGMAKANFLVECWESKLPHSTGHCREEAGKRSLQTGARFEFMRNCIILYEHNH